MIKEKLYTLTLEVLMRNIIFLVPSILLINGCATKIEEEHAPNPKLIKQCYLTSNIQTKMAQHYINGDDSPSLYAKYVDNASNEKLKEFLKIEIKEIIDKKPQNPYDYGTEKYLNCMSSNGQTVPEKNVKTCLPITLSSELAIKLKNAGISKDEAISVISKNFPPESPQYKISKSSIEKWYSGSNLSISDFLYSEFNQCMQLME